MKHVFMWPVHLLPPNWWMDGGLFKPCESVRMSCSETPLETLRALTSVAADRCQSWCWWRNRVTPWTCCSGHGRGDKHRMEAHERSLDSHPLKNMSLPEGFRRQDAESGLLQHLTDLVASSSHRVGLHLLAALAVRGKLQVTGQIRDGEAVALPLLNLRDVRTTVLLLVPHAALKLFENCDKVKTVCTINYDFCLNKLLICCLLIVSKVVFRYELRDSKMLMQTKT